LKKARGFSAKGFDQMKGLADLNKLKSIANETRTSLKSFADDAKIKTNKALQKKRS
jgi:hypothetical protein